MHVACVLIDHFPYKLESQRNSELTNLRVIIFHNIGSRRVVLDAHPPSKQVYSGMRLQEALAQYQYKDAMPIEANSGWYQQEFYAILLRLGDISPLVEDAGLGCAYVGLDGLENTYGNEERLLDLLLQAIPAHMEPRIGVSKCKFTAYLTALCAKPGKAMKTPEDISTFLAPWSVDVLPVASNIKAGLRSFGLSTLGQIAQKPIGPIGAQFGSIGTTIWHLAQGIDDTPLIPQRYEEAVQESLTFPTPTIEIAALLLALDNLIGRIFSRTEMQGRYALMALIEGTVYNRPSWQRRVIFKMPIGNRRHAFYAIKTSVEGMSASGPIEDISLTFKKLIGEVGLQESLFRDIRQKQQLGQAITQLKVSQGTNPIYRVMEVEPWSRIPERRAALVTYDP